MKAKFGQLGELDFTFTPSRGAGPCHEFAEGTFEGSFAFTGENEYVSFEADRARGTFLASAAKGCKGARRSTGTPRPASAESTDEAAADEAFFTAHTRLPLPARSLLVLEFVEKGRPQVSFNAFLEEKKEGMTVARGAATAGPRSDFTWNLAAGTAHLRPPAPFTGAATFKRRPGGASVWRGSLRAPVPGGTPIRLTGGDFVAQLLKGSIVD